MIRIKSVMVTIEEEGKPDSNHMMPMDVFMYWFYEFRGDEQIGYWSSSKLKELRNWRPS